MGEAIPDVARRRLPNRRPQELINFEHDGRCYTAEGEGGWPHLSQKRPVSHHPCGATKSALHGRD
jgi:hypothetical protein